MTEQNNQKGPLDQFMPDSGQQFDPADIEKNKAMAGLAYIIFFLPLIACPESRYARFHANQGLLLLLLSIVCGIVISILTTLFAVMLSLALLSIIGILSTIVWLAVAVLGIMGLINGFTGKAKELPIIGKIKIIK